ncbi:MAG: hypothetical protein U5M50_01420 [Sphingobium sp.]|nr:hypothetical protein [Sphingobium sp.]
MFGRLRLRLELGGDLFGIFAGKDQLRAIEILLAGNFRRKSAVTK